MEVEVSSAMCAGRACGLCGGAAGSRRTVWSTPRDKSVTRPAFVPVCVHHPSSV